MRELIGRRFRDRGLDCRELRQQVLVQGRGPLRDNRGAEPARAALLHDALKRTEAPMLLGPDGDISVRVDQAGTSTVHLIIDVNGYFE